MVTRRRTSTESDESSSRTSRQYERGTHIERDGIVFKFPPGTVCPTAGMEEEDYFDLLSCLSNPRVLNTAIQFKHDLGIGRAGATGFALGFLVATHVGGLMWTLFALDEPTNYSSALMLWCVYFIALCSYHMLEFCTTARYNPAIVSNRSFLINHSDVYTYAVLVSWAEFVLELAFFPQLKGPAGVPGELVLCLGLALLIMGQVFRSGAMITAKSNFTHLISVRKVASHKLVQDGVYRYLRHPSYFGWFWWSIATQVSA
jgi:protein-S-isoprenylcysteine O-methyltransferase